MEGKHPKRRKDKYNPYNIYAQEGHYYVSFKDGQDILHKFEISEQIYEALDFFELEDISYLNIWDRHLEQSEICEETLNERVFQKPESLEEFVMKKLQTEQLYKAMVKLPEVQRYRLYLYYFKGMTYAQIAIKEKCSFQAVAKSIAAAEKNLKKFLI